MRASYISAINRINVNSQAIQKDATDYPALVQEITELPNGHDKAILLLALLQSMQTDKISFSTLKMIAPFPELEKSRTGSYPLVDLGKDPEKELYFYPNANASAIEANNILSVASNAWRESIDLVNVRSVTNVWSPKSECKPAP